MKIPAVGDFTLLGIFIDIFCEKGFSQNYAVELMTIANLWCVNLTRWGAWCVHNTTRLPNSVYTGCCSELSWHPVEHFGQLNYQNQPLTGTMPRITKLWKLCKYHKLFLGRFKHGFCCHWSFNNGPFQKWMALFLLIIDHWNFHFITYETLPNLTDLRQSRAILSASWIFSG